MKVILLLVMFLICNGASPAENIRENSLEIFPDEIENVLLIKFSISEHAFVYISLSDENGSTSETLAEGEMEDGAYCVYYKTPQNAAGKKFVCRMILMDNEKSGIIFSKEVVVGSN